MKGQPEPKVNRVMRMKMPEIYVRKDVKGRESSLYQQSSRERSRSRVRRRRQQTRTREKRRRNDSDKSDWLYLNLGRNTIGVPAGEKEKDVLGNRTLPVQQAATFSLKMLKDWAP